MPSEPWSVCNSIKERDPAKATVEQGVQDVTGSIQLSVWQHLFIKLGYLAEGWVCIFFRPPEIHSFLQFFFFSASWAASRNFKIIISTNSDKKLKDKDCVSTIVDDSKTDHQQINFPESWMLKSGLYHNGTFWLVTMIKQWGVICCQMDH